MSIQYEINTLEQWLETDTVNEPKELKDLIYKQAEYLQTQSKRLQPNNRRILLLETVQALMKLYNEYPEMISGRINNNNEPF